MNLSSDQLFTLHQGDARQLGRLLDRLSKPNNEPPVMCTITSPPYGAIKNYGHDDQIGWGQPYDEYLVEMRRIFRAIYYRTRLEGSLWLIADTLRADDQRSADLPQRMEPLPFQLAEQAAEAGWILRDTLIWQKQKTLPWSSGRRLRNVFEYVLLFVKSSSYKFYSDRLRDPENLQEWWVKWPERYNPIGKIPTNVWEIPIPQQGTWGSSAVQHVCPLPPDLVERLIFLSTDRDDTVFDPFAGTGVVVAEAERLGRRGIGIELNKSHVLAYSKKIRPEILARNNDDPLQERMERAEELRTSVIKLRALKYGKVIWQGLTRDKAMPLPQLVLVLASKIRPSTMMDATTPLPVKVLFVYPSALADRLDPVQLRLKEIVSRPPATKYGIAGEVLAITWSDVPSHLTRNRLFLYERGNTWNAARAVRASELESLQPTAARSAVTYPYPPIVGNLEVHEMPGPRS